MKRFEGRVAVITGAAGGFGRELARIGAQAGMKLVLADIDPAGLEDLAAELRTEGAEALAWRCDVRHANEVEALADAAQARFGAVHLLFNNAGVALGGLLWEYTQADWEWVLGVNLWGVIHGVRTFTPRMLAAARDDRDYEGHIVNTASMAGLVNAPAMGAYNVSKHGVVSLSETLRHDLDLVAAPIGVSVLCPYFVPTGIAHSELHRPDDVRRDAAPTVSQRVAQSMTEKAVAAGKVSAAEVGRATFAAVAEQRFYIHSHPHALGGLRARLDDIAACRNPGDPYRDAPHVRRMLEDALRAPDAGLLP